MPEVPLTIEDTDKAYNKGFNDGYVKAHEVRAGTYFQDQEVWNAGYEEGLKENPEVVAFRRQLDLPMISIWFKPLDYHRLKVSEEEELVQLLCETYAHPQWYAEKLLQGPPLYWKQPGGPLTESKMIELYFAFQKAGFEVQLRPKGDYKWPL